MGDFRELRAWQEAVQLVALSRDPITKLPDCERFALADQWRRAAYSVVLNIAEGASRKGPREFRRFLDIARSSLHEIEVILVLVEAQGYMRREDLAKVSESRTNCARMVFGLIQSMTRSPNRGVKAKHVTS